MTDEPIEEPKFEWTKESTVQLLDLWNAQKKSGIQIGLILGIGKNAVRGKLHRLRVAGHFVREGDVRTPAQVTASTRKIALVREEAKRQASPPKLKKDSEWSDEATRELIRRWNLGESARIVANALGVVRGAVSAKVDRLRRSGVEMRTGQPAKPRVGRYIPSFHNKPQSFRFQADTDAALPPPNITHLRNTYAPNRNTSAGLKALASADASMTGEGISILEFNRGKCGNVTGGSAPEWLFCGEPTGSVKATWCPKCRPLMTHGYASGAIVARVTRTMDGIRPYRLTWRRNGQWYDMHGTRKADLQAKFETGLCAGKGAANG